MTTLLDLMKSNSFDAAETRVEQGETLSDSEIGQLNTNQRTQYVQILIRVSASKIFKIAIAKEMKDIELAQAALALANHIKLQNDAIAAAVPGKSENDTGWQP